MCGISAIFCPKCSDPKTYLDKCRPVILAAGKKIRHRGPDWSGVYQDHSDDLTCSMAHERLSIVDPEGGAQPIISHDGSLVLGVNGEIYCHRQLRTEYSDYPFQTGSDCEVISCLYEHVQKGDISYQKMMDDLDGPFAFVLFDKSRKQFMVGRDPIGINCFYYGKTVHGEYCFASELKAIDSLCVQVYEFPPGHYGLYTEKEGFQIVQYYRPLWEHVPFRNDELEPETLRLHNVLEQAVEKRLMADVPFGVLLSGGLDSALISAIVKKLVDKYGTKFGHELHSFSIGMKDSPDLAAAKKVAKMIGTIHHSIEFTFQEALDAVPHVIETLETYDVTTIRASTPMYLLSRFVKSMGIKMVLSGEGADELLGGYLHFHKAPSDDAFHEECKDRIKKLHLFDCLRANKSTMAWGLEARVPFLDKEVLEVAMPIHPKWKCYNTGDKKIEKYVLRYAFKDGYLPDEIVWRQKEQFSDGVGYGWIDGLKAHAEKTISDDLFSMATDLYPYNTPQTKEAFLYRQIFSSFYPKARAEMTVAKWVPRQDWGCDADPSGRSQGAHAAHSDWHKTS